MAAVVVLSSAPNRTSTLLPPPLPRPFPASFSSTSSSSSFSLSSSSKASYGSTSSLVGRNDVAAVLRRPRPRPRLAKFASRTPAAPLRLRRRRRRRRRHHCPRPCSSAGSRPAPGVSSSWDAEVMIRAANEAAAAAVAAEEEEDEDFFFRRLEQWGSRCNQQREDNVVRQVGHKGYVI